MIRKAHGENKTITTIEYGKLVKGVDINDAQYDLLEKFILANQRIGEDGERVNIMGFTHVGDKKAITAKQYVGTITLKDGTNIEILPKIYNDNSLKADEEKRNTKKILIKMLQTLFDAKSKNFQNANLEVSKLPLLEIFIRMFLDEALTIVKKGLKGGYVMVESNENFLKGKLLLCKHIRKNYIHKEKFYIGYDEFNINQPENRLIKSTLAYLEKRTASIKNRQFIKQLLTAFDEVPLCKNVDADIAMAKATKGRNSACYQTALKWSEVFLKGKTFTTFAGKEYATAVLFDMNALFESYIARKVSYRLSGIDESKHYTFSVQDNEYYLFNDPERFSLRPDMVITDNNFTDNKGGKTKCTYILDTKWKILSKLYENGGVSQADMYQMYAYFKEYEANDKNPRNVTLVYPKVDNSTEHEYKNKNKNKIVNDVIVRVRFVDLTKVIKGGFDDEIDNLLKDLDMAM